MDIFLDTCPCGRLFPIGVVAEPSTAGIDDFAIEGIRNSIIFEQYRETRKIEICANADDSNYEGNEEFSLLLQPDGESLDDQIGFPNRANVLIISQNRKLAVRCASDRYLGELSVLFKINNQVLATLLQDFPSFISLPLN